MEENWDELCKIEERAEWQREIWQAVSKAVKSRVRKEEIRAKIEKSIELEEVKKTRGRWREGLDGRWRRTEKERSQRRR